MRTKKQKPRMKVVHGWAVLGTPSNKGGLEYEHGYPMIHIQRIKPKVVRWKVMEVVPCQISYPISSKKKV